MALSQEEIFEKVQEALIDALGVDDDEVTREATLVPREELSPEDVLTNSEYVKDGVVTAEGMAELKRRMPWADLSEFEKNPRVQDFGNLLTVGDLCNYVETKVGA